MTLAREILKTTAIGAALMSSTSALAQWQGTWDTKYGDVKLHQTGQHVYGDYGTWGTIEGLVSQDRRTIRGVYRRNDDGSSGYFEWRINGTQNYFTGHWASPQSALPRWNGGGPQWTGSRTRSAKPTLSVYRGNGNIGDFFGRQDVKYINWARAVSSASAPPNTASAGQSTAAAPAKPKTNPLAKRYPKLADYSADFKPRFFEISLEELTGLGTEQRPEIYGLIGIYAYCESASGSRALRSFGNLKARVFDLPRNNPARVRTAKAYFFGESTIRKFPVDAACMREPDARLKIQLQTNLREKEIGGGARDEVYGYRSLAFYLDLIPSSEQPSKEVVVTEADIIILQNTSGRRAKFFASLRDPQGPKNRAFGLRIQGTVEFTQ